MKFPWYYSLFLFLGSITLFGFGSEFNGIPEQPSFGPGGANYIVDSVIMEDFAKKPDGYWLFRPAEQEVPLEELIIFNHGYGAYNPMIYGAWIKHLVRKRNIVIFPRYQRNLITPRPKKFVKNATQAIVDGLEDLRARKLLVPGEFHLSLVGHSYGGVVAAGLANDYRNLGIPKPEVLMICSPGSGPFSGGVLEAYDQLDPDLKMISIVSIHDPTVGEGFGRHVFKTSPQVKQSNFIRQLPDTYNGLRVSAAHNEPYALDMQFDSGVRNVSAKRALRIATIDPVDYFGYWKLFDALRDCSISGENCKVAFGNTAAQTYLGLWAENHPIRPLEVYTNPALLP